MPGCKTRVMDLAPAATPEQLDALEAQIDAWLAAEQAVNPMIDAVEKGEREVGHQQRLWYVRLLGEEKDVWTAYWTINQRMFRFETFLMPAPEENEQAFYEHLLMRNRELTGMNLEIRRQVLKIPAVARQTMQTEHYRRVWRRARIVSRIKGQPICCLKKII